MWATVRKYRATFLFLVITNALVGLADLFFGAVFLFRYTVIDILGYLNQPAWLATLVSEAQHFLATMPKSAVFLVVFYFVSHGVVKLFLAIVLFQNRLWAYPIAIFFFVLFTAYQGVVMYKDASVFNIFLTILNLVVLLLAVFEYKKARALLPTTIDISTVSN